MGWDPVSKKEIWGTDQIFITPEGTCKVGAFSDDWRHFNLRMIPKQQFPYGFFEFRARWRGNSGVHTACWCASPNIIKTVNGPFIPTDLQNIPGGVEFDLAEHRVVDETGKNINAWVNIAEHHNGYAEFTQSAGRFYEQGDPNVWRTYQLLHTPQDGMILYIDGKQIWTWRAHTSKKMNMFLSAEIWMDGKTGAPTNSWSGPLPSSYGNSPANSTAYIECDWMRFTGDKDYGKFETLCSNGLMSALKSFQDQGLIKAYDSQAWLTATYGSLNDVNLIYHQRIPFWRSGDVQGNKSNSLTNKEAFLALYTGEWLDVPKLENFLKVAKSTGLIQSFDYPGSLMALYGRQIGAWKYIVDQSVLGQIYDDYVPQFWSKGLTKAGSISSTTTSVTPWIPGISYKIGQKVVYYNNKTYICITPHTAQADWTPTLTPSLWREI